MAERSAAAAGAAASKGWSGMEGTPGIDGAVGGNAAGAAGLAASPVLESASSRSMPMSASGLGWLSIRPIA